MQDGMPAEGLFNKRLVWLPLCAHPPLDLADSWLVWHYSGCYPASLQRPRWPVSPRCTSWTDRGLLHRRLDHARTTTTLSAPNPVGQQRRRGYSVGRCRPSSVSEPASPTNRLSVCSYTAPVGPLCHSRSTTVVQSESVVATQRGRALPDAQSQEDGDASVFAVYVRPSAAV